MIINRAILGRLERFIAVLLETTSGFLPFGIAPRHVAVLPVSAALSAYAQMIVDELKRVCPAAHVEVMDAATASLGKRVRECVQSRVSNAILPHICHSDVVTVTVTDAILRLMSQASSINSKMP